MFGTLLSEFETEWSELTEYEEYEDGFYDYDTTELSIAVMDGNLDEVNRLIADGADLDEQDYYGETALAQATYNADVEMLEVLLEAGADPNITDEYGTTPLINTLYYRDYESAAILLEHGADPEIEDDYGDSALNLMNVETKEELIEALNK